MQSGQILAPSACCGGHYESYIDGEGGGTVAWIAMKPLVVWPLHKPGRSRGTVLQAGLHSASNLLKLQVPMDARRWICICCTRFIYNLYRVINTLKHLNFAAQARCDFSHPRHSAPRVRPVSGQHHPNARLPAWHADRSRTRCVPPGCVAPRLWFIATVSQAAASRKLLSAV